MNITNTILKILKDLIAIPSFVGEGNPQNENGVVDYIESWVKKNTNFEIERHSLNGNRYNLIVKSGTPETLFLAHTDTVAPSTNSKYNQLISRVINGELWGRGATDMKSGIALLMTALLNPKAITKNFWMVFYADEEYSFLGMKSFLDKFSDIRPKLIISADGSDNKVDSGCRGLIEIVGRIKGQTGHPAKGTGNSAIKGAMSVLNDLEKYLDGIKHDVLGDSPLNIAYILGGAETQNSFKNSMLFNVSKAGNVVPDICEFVIDIRPSVDNLRADTINKFVSEKCAEKDLTYETVSINHDLGSWYTAKEEIVNELNCIKSVLSSSELSKPNETGYIDLQMAWEKFGKPPAFTFGSGLGMTAHKSDERIIISNLLKGEGVFSKIIENIK